MRRINRIRLKVIWLTLSIGILLPLVATAQTNSVNDLGVTRPAPSGVPVILKSDVDECVDRLATCESRLLKTLDALEKAEALLVFKNKEIAAHVELQNLYKQAIAVKDLIIQYQDELIKRLRGNKTGFMARFKRILGIAEKIALIAVGISVGRGL